MRIILAAGGVAAILSGCITMREGNPWAVGSYPHQWEFPGPEFERKVFGPLQFDEVREFVRERESEGWEMIGYEPASLPEDVMVNAVELDRPAPAKRPTGSWTFDIPKTMDDGYDPPRDRFETRRSRSDGFDAPARASIPPYVGSDVKGHRQKYLIIMRRWS
jgi:hypothetical protein